MCKYLLLFAILFPALLAFARDKPENWVEVRSPHFVVVSNAGDKLARRVADQFERMRAVFHKFLPRLQIDPPAPIIVLAVKDEKAFRALEPAVYLAKGQLKIDGLFLHGLDKNYVLMRLDTDNPHPYSVVYHEYTHLLLSKADWMPLWLNEGLAEFYENTDIHEKEVSLGEPSPENLLLLRQNLLLPLATLFTVDQSSPYYHEEHKGSIFYGESWALTHYLEITDYRDKTQRLTGYVQLLSQNVDAVTAATRAFGDLKQLQAALESYVEQRSFQYFKMPGATEVDDKAFQTQALISLQADVVRADFLAYNVRSEDARVLIGHILQEEPNNVPAHEAMGYLEFREQHMEEARRWYAEAVQLDSQSYLAHYYFAAISMNGAVAPGEVAPVENSLRACIKLNPLFAPCYNALAVFLMNQQRNLDEARLMGLSAIELDPGNLSYRINNANVLLQMERGKDAVAVIRNAMRLAKSPQETAMAENFLRHAQEYAQMQEQNRLASEQLKAETSVAETTQTSGSPANSAPDEAVPTGLHHFVVGVLKDVRCSLPAMDLNVVSGGKALALHARNYFKVDYSVLNLKFERNLNPCVDLEGRTARVEYVDATGKSAAAVIAVEIRK